MPQNCVCLYECTDDGEYFSETLTEKKKRFLHLKHGRYY